MGIGPVPASRRALAAPASRSTQMDLVEINEAFAAQYLAVEQELGLDRERTNVDGGAVAIGHPLGASGARITLHLLHALRRTGGRTASAPPASAAARARRSSSRHFRNEESPWNSDAGAGRRGHLLVPEPRVVRQYERGVAFFLGGTGAPRGPGSSSSLPVRQPEAGLAPDRGAGHPAAGRDHPRQRLGQGERRPLHAGDRPGQGDHRDRGLPLRHQPAGPDHASLGAG